MRQSNVVAKAAVTILLAGVCAQGCAADPGEGDVSEGDAADSVSSATSALSSSHLVGESGRLDIILKAKLLALRGDDGKVDRSKLIPSLDVPSPLPYAGCAQTKDGPLCWGSQDVEYSNEEFDVCPDGRSIYTSEKRTEFFARQYDKNNKAWYRATISDNSKFDITLNASGAKPKLNNLSHFYVERVHPTHGDFSTFYRTWSGSYDYTLSKKGKPVWIDVGVLQENEEGDILFQSGRWDSWNDYDGALDRICKALDGKL